MTWPRADPGSGPDARRLGRFRRAGGAIPGQGRLRGRIATFLEWTGGNVFEERVTIAVKGDGSIEIYATTQGMG